MQFQGPVEKGMYEPGGMSFAFVSLNLSGSNFKGSGKYFGFMFISGRETRIPVPLEMFVGPLKTNILHFIHSICWKILQCKNARRNVIECPLMWFCQAVAPVGAVAWLLLRTFVSIWILKYPPVLIVRLIRKQIRSLLELSFESPGLMLRRTVSLLLLLQLYPYP